MRILYYVCYIPRFSSCQAWAGGPLLGSWYRPSLKCAPSPLVLMIKQDFLRGLAAPIIESIDPGVLEFLRDYLVPATIALKDNRLSII